MFHFAWFPHNIPHGIKAHMLHICGFPHSEISGSKVVATSPKRIAGYRVFHRLIVPRHPPYTLLCFNLKIIQNNWQAICDHDFKEIKSWTNYFRIQCLIIGSYNFRCTYNSHTLAKLSLCKKIYLQYLFWWLSPEQITTIQFGKYLVARQVYINTHSCKRWCMQFLISNCKFFTTT